MPQVLAAFLLDLLIGDPRWFPHPVIGIGKLISILERHLNKKTAKKWTQRAGGVLLVTCVVSFTWLICWSILMTLTRFHFWAGQFIGILMLWTTFATKSLKDAAWDVLKPLTAGDLPQARTAVSWIVGRDTASLSEAEIVRATVETVAENTSDGIIAPLFFALIGGAPLAMAYKAINTMDSMLGYKNERYLHFGWAAARLDDVANLVPARLTAAFLVISSVLCGKSCVASVHAIFRDAHKHPSPNSGYPEAAVAGALGVQLGGRNTYEGTPSERARMGVPKKPLTGHTIRESVLLMYVSSLLATACAVLVISLFGINSWKIAGGFFSP